MRGHLTIAHNHLEQFKKRVASGLRAGRSRSTGPGGRQKRPAGTARTAGAEAGRYGGNGHSGNGRHGGRPLQKKLL